MPIPASIAAHAPAVVPHRVYRPPMIAAPPPATKMLPVRAPYIAMYSPGCQRRLKRNANIATPSTASFRRRSWRRGDIGRRRNGSTTSCTKMLPHECRYASSVLTAAPSIAATTSPSIPAGSITPRASGTRISAWSASVGCAAIISCRPADAAACSGWVRKARTASGTSTVTSIRVR